MTATDHAEAAPTTGIVLEPYLYFYGRCEEALNFYERVFGGKSEIMRIEETPPPVREHFAALDGRLVMHASFKSPGVNFMASDGMERKAVDPDAGNISLAIAAPDGPTGERLFAALADGGTVKMPIGPAFWGGRFGNVIDRFGTDWMMTLP